MKYLFKQCKPENSLNLEKKMKISNRPIASSINATKEGTWTYRWETEQNIEQVSEWEIEWEREREKERET